MKFEELPISALKEPSASSERKSAFIAAINSLESFETRRLRFRPMRLPLENEDIESSDVKKLHQLVAPSKVHKWIYSFKKGFTPLDSLEWIQTSLSKQKEGTAIAFLLEDRKSGETIGEIDANLDPDRLAADIACAISPKQQRHAYHMEAAEAFMRLLCGAGVQHLVLTATPGNIPSQKAISKLGVPELKGVTLEMADADGDPVLQNLFYIRAEEWVAQNPVAQKAEKINELSKLLSENKSTNLNRGLASEGDKDLAR